jgi:hypothetical protein
VEKLELTIVSLKAELSSVATKIEVMTGESNTRNKLITEQDSMIADLNS